MITIYLLLSVVVLIFVICKWMDSNSYHDPPDGTVYKYDTEDSEFSATQIDYEEAKKKLNNEKE